MKKVVTLEPFDVMYVSEIGEPWQVAGRAFQKLEKVVSLKGRKFYATYDSASKEYRAAVKIQEGDNSEVLDLKVATIAGGKYATDSREGPYLEIVKQVGPMFDSLLQEYRQDASRLPVEFYKRHTEVHVYLPIL